MKRECVSCGDSFYPSRCPGVDEHLTTEQLQSLNRYRQTRCEMCARELAIGCIPRMGTTMHGTGGGERVIKSARGMS